MLSKALCFEILSWSYNLWSSSFPYCEKLKKFAHFPFSISLMVLHIFNMSQKKEKKTCFTIVNISLPFSFLFIFVISFLDWNRNACRTQNIDTLYIDNGTMTLLCSVRNKLRFWWHFLLCSLSWDMSAWHTVYTVLLPPCFKYFTFISTKFHLPFYCPIIHCHDICTLSWVHQIWFYDLNYLNIISRFCLLCNIKDSCGAPLVNSLY